MIEVIKRTFGPAQDRIPSNPIPVTLAGKSIPKYQYLCKEGAVCVACGCGPDHDMYCSVRSNLLEYCEIHKCHVDACVEASHETDPERVWRKQ